ncbi:MAG: DMT family transporter [Flavobacteriaceae bacterium]|nr:DMT family transporter [Flavobacteriaceae bacterium]
MSENLKGILSASITALLWGLLAVAMKVALGYMGTVPIIWFRFSFATLFLLVFYLVKRPNTLKEILRSFPIALLFAALFLGYNYLGFVSGLDHTTPATTQVVIQTGPLLLTLSGILIFKEKVNRYQLMGLGIAVVGLLLFYYNQLKTLSDVNTYNIGFLWILSAAVSWTCYAILQKRLVKKYEPQLLNLFIYGIPALLFLPPTDFQEFYHLEIWQWALLIFLGLNTLVAYGFLALAFKYTQAYKVSIIITLNPIITVVTMALLSYLNVDWITSENFSALSFLGAFLLISGAVITVFFSQKTPKKLFSKQ